MTTQILVVATTGDNPFAIRRTPNPEPVGQRLLTTVYPSDGSPPPQVAPPGLPPLGALDIVRTGPGQGFVANLGPRFVHVHYVRDGREVGPRLDLLAPGAIRELGIGDGVAWRIKAVE